MGFGAADRRRQRQLLQALSEANEHNVVDYLSFSSANPSSIRNCIENARLNSRSVRTALTSRDVGHHQQRLDRFAGSLGKGTKTREELNKFLRFVQEISLRFDGSAYRTMLRNDAYWFSRLGCIWSAPTTPRAFST